MSAFFGQVQERQHACGVTLTALSHLAGRVLPIHPHERAYFALLLSGGYCEATRRRQIEYRSCSLVYHPPDFAHSDVIAPAGARFFIIEMNAAAEGKDVVQVPELAADALALYRRFRQRSLAAIDFEEAAVRLLGRFTTTEVREAFRPIWLRNAVERVHAEYADGLTLAGLAGEAGVHPVHFSRVFRRHMGMRVGEYLHRLRIRKAVSVLVEERCSISEAAHRTGFADHAHFTRVCREFTGATPRELTAVIQSALHL